ncbi:MAG: MBL fold metallo-hydrolase [Myxococcales bacterium]|nr:MBL fold metallo-hydrolase [Myxococcales bacterium]
MDAFHPQDLCFVSHAHVSTTVAHHKVLATDATLRLFRRHEPSQQVRGLVCPYNRPFSLGQLSIELFPAGHILGSAQIRVTKDDLRLVYTGDFSFQRKLTCEAIEVKSCDELIIPAHFAHPRYEFPAIDDGYALLTSEVRRALDDKRVPVVFTATVGTAQEVAKRLAREGFNLRLHRSIYEKNKIYVQLGVSLESCKCFRGTPRPDEVIIWPRNLRSSPAIKSLRRARTILLSGHAVVPGYARQQRVDIALPITDSASYSETLDYIERVAPRKIYVAHGYAPSFTAELRKRGLDAESLTNEQIGFDFGQAH